MAFLGYFPALNLTESAGCVEACPFLHMLFSVLVAGLSWLAMYFIIAFILGKKGELKNLEL